MASVLSMRICQTWKKGGEVLNLVSYCLPLYLFTVGSCMPELENSPLMSKR